ncbi:MAG: outer membrane lipid asymmetry maintenance protein MlaD [Rickettsiales bacterium]|nr:outer membrane lipid asymmetry maintenance protein MlaD [Rickettsiales bacterium]|tara:strand:- start:3019 stop:3471 length:453 start_codon:yes stop_codon:yes gene_type:complete
MKSNILESILGLVTLIIAVVFFISFVNANNQNFSDQTYNLKAKFLKVGGIMIGNDVKLRGVKVGIVKKVQLDKEFFASVEFEVDSKIKVPKNSTISVFSDGLLGNKYLSIMPGEILNEDDYLLDNQEIKNVVDFESIEDQVSKIIFLATQ